MLMLRRELLTAAANSPYGIVRLACATAGVMEACDYIGRAHISWYIALSIGLVYSIACEIRERRSARKSEVAK